MVWRPTGSSAYRRHGQLIGSCGVPLRQRKRSRPYSIRRFAETAAKLGREPGGRGREAVYFSNGRGLVAVDAAFAEAMETSPSWPLWQQAWPTLEREQKRFDGALTNGSGGWRATETGRLWFHPADFPVRVWAVGIEPQGVVWVDTEITGIDNTYVRVR
jgi:hypothetical protein